MLVAGPGHILVAVDGVVPSEGTADRVRRVRPLGSFRSSAGVSFHKLARNPKVDMGLQVKGRR